MGESVGTRVGERGEKEGCSPRLSSTLLYVRNVGEEVCASRKSGYIRADVRGGKGVIKFGGEALVGAGRIMVGDFPAPFFALGIRFPFRFMVASVKIKYDMYLIICSKHVLYVLLFMTSVYVVYLWWTLGEGGIG